MLELNVYHDTRSIYFIKYVHLLFCEIVVVLCIAEITLLYITFTTNLRSYGSLYYIHTIIEYVLISLSSAGAILGIYGILSNIKNNHILIILYGSLTFLLFLIEVSLCMLYVYCEYNSIIDNYIVEQLKNHYILSTKTTESLSILDYIQEKHKCCGLYGPIYNNGTYINTPVSCCPEQQCQISIYLEGCLPKLLSTSIYGLVILYYVQGTLICLQISSMILTIVFAKNIIDIKVGK